MDPFRTKFHVFVRTYLIEKHKKENWAHCQMRLPLRLPRAAREGFSLNLIGGALGGTLQQRSCSYVQMKMHVYGPKGQTYYGPQGAQFEMCFIFQIRF